MSNPYAGAKTHGQVIEKGFLLFIFYSRNKRGYWIAVKVGFFETSF